MQAENIYNGSEVAGCRFLLDSGLRATSRYKRRRVGKAAGVTSMSLIPKKGTVYVVDDDEAVRDSLQWLLEGKDYRSAASTRPNPSWRATTRARSPA